MCGGDYAKWQTPRHLTKIYGETIVERTIRLLKEHGVTDIAISSNDKAFEGFGVPVLKHKNDYYTTAYNQNTGYWCNAFYDSRVPSCYMFGDVVFSDMAVQIITEYETDSIMLFGSKEPFSPEYPKWYIEPFAFKVQDQKLLRWAIKEVKRLDSIGAFHRKPIAWELWNVICGGDPNVINNGYVAINDYTCDIDNPEEISIVQAKAKEAKPMAAKKETTKTAKAKAKKEPARKPAKRAEKKPEQATFNGKQYEILERTPDRFKLTDGTIHFWARADRVETN